MCEPQSSILFLVLPRTLDTIRSTSHFTSADPCQNLFSYFRLVFRIVSLFLLQMPHSIKPKTITSSGDCLCTASSLHISKLARWQLFAVPSAGWFNFFCYGVVTNDDKVKGQFSRGLGSHLSAGCSVRISTSCYVEALEIKWTAQYRFYWSHIIVV